MKFTKEAKGLVVENFYLLKNRRWSESGFLIAQCVGFEDGHPVFVDDVQLSTIDADDIEGWVALDF